MKDIEVACIIMKKKYIYIYIYIAQTLSQFISLFTTGKVAKINTQQSSVTIMPSLRCKMVLLL